MKQHLRACHLFLWRIFTGQKLQTQCNDTNQHCVYIYSMNVCLACRCNCVKYYLAIAKYVYLDSSNPVVWTTVAAVCIRSSTTQVLTLSILCTYIWRFSFCVNTFDLVTCDAADDTLPDAADVIYPHR